MTGMSGRWRLTGSLLLACAAISGLLALEWRGRSVSVSGAGVGSETAPDAASAPAPSDRFTPPALASFDAVLERPLFNPDRRPVVVPESAAAPAATPTVPLRARLEGVVRIGATSFALIRDLSRNEAVRLAQGMELNGWTLDRVESGRAVLSRGDGQVQELKLERQRD
jgi:hypothetical protein